METFEAPFGRTARREENPRGKRMPWNTKVSVSVLLAQETVCAQRSAGFQWFGQVVSDQVSRKPVERLITRAKRFQALRSLS